ncbi:MAG: hypothetical protein KBI41_00785 [Kiritimatiellae bacterium]|jgi:hypothetical protein|nr:hypothetical protein [Kiritimatiellia bacterium]MDD2346728.1 hypothetical protein [Kiritimatiellia bacterium]MDD3582492.1 hypothetical protein [Kiritimatiellia bacterium]HHU13728.1 hypothetical protein [Lentisphaerota bacterium]HON47995.1 hypothetical protein [Kiritimatiellia bacterium]
MPAPVRLVTPGAGTLLISVLTVADFTVSALAADAVALLAVLESLSVPFFVRTANQSVSVVPSGLVPRSQ